MWGVDSSSGGMCVATLYGHTDDVTGVSPLSDSTLVSVSLDKTARLWFLETQAEGGLGMYLFEILPQLLGPRLFNRFPHSCSLHRLFAKPFTDSLRYCDWR